MILFTKMQGCGNDYVYINNDIEKVQNMSEFTKKVSNRNFGIGSDGCIFIFKDDEADIAFRIFNSDGSEAKMCGNGIRCVAKYAYEKGQMALHDTHVRSVEVYVENGIVKNVKVNMGIPDFNTKRLQINYPKDVLINERFDILDTKLYLTCVSVGNLHTVVFVDNVDNFNIEKYGSAIEKLSIFKDRTNVEFVEVIDRENIKVRVWERGVGETLACGTGATASVIAGYLNGVTESICNVILKGGKIEIVYNEINNELSMIGTAEIVYEGKLY